MFEVGEYIVYGCKGVCQVEEIAYLDTSEIFEYSIARHVPQYFHFETNVIKELYES